MTYYKFIKIFINQLKSDFRESKIRPSTSSSNNRLNKLHIPNMEERKQNNIVLSDRKTPSDGTHQTYYFETCINQQIYNAYWELLQN